MENKTLTKKQREVLENCLKAVGEAGFTAAIFALVAKEGAKKGEILTNLSFLGSEANMYALFHAVGENALNGTCESHQLSDYRAIASGMMYAFLEDEVGMQILREKLKDNEQK